MPTIAQWEQWVSDWRRMEEIARRRGWDFAPVRIAPPAPARAIDALEARHGLECPPQLRELLTERSARVSFEWNIPSHLRPIDPDLPCGSFNRGALWDLAHIDDPAIPNFVGWKEQLAPMDTPGYNQGMWGKQFPLYGLVNGDMVTIDMSRPEGPHPVRYFSHELDMLHGRALAPDLFTFVTEMSKLGFAGTEWASWLPFGVSVGDTYYLSASSAGGKAWIAWRERDPAVPGPDEPPPAIVEATAAERALLESARQHRLDGVKAALAAGARPDVVCSEEWLDETTMWSSDEFCTAVTYAARADSIAMLETLLAHGAALNTRRLPLCDAVEVGSLETVNWLIAHGARVNGWKHQRHWPLHVLVTQREKPARLTRDEYVRQVREADERGQRALRRGAGAASLPESFWAEMTARDERRLAELIRKHVDAPTYRAMLEALLLAGADPDAPWDNGLTMLMWGDATTAAILLRYGADVHARDAEGRTALHMAQSPEKVRVLVAHGADVDARMAAAPGGTPLQHFLLFESRLDLARTLLALGADPTIRDRTGRSTLAWCTTVQAFRVIQPHGLDPLERMPDGGTLLHNLLVTSSLRAASPHEVAFLDLLLGLGLDINATDAAGRTVLHLAVENTQDPADIALLLDRGADRSIADAAGRRPVDLVGPSAAAIRDLLR